VTPNIDTTTYAQAANLNADGSHGPVKCGSCHADDNNGIPTWLRNSTRWEGGQISGSFDAAVTWAHTYTDEQSVLISTCLNCHGVQGTNWSEVQPGNGSYMNHAMSSSSKDLPRGMMDKAEMALNDGVVFGFNADGTANTGQRTQACQACHGQELGSQTCDTEWKEHLTQGRVSQALWEELSAPLGGCGW
jgi:formate-dependent nitrite reductase cytochrome c552 subunit